MNEIRLYHSSSHLPTLPFKKSELKKWIIAAAHQEEFVIEKLFFNFIGDEELLSINQKFLNHNYYTDIITFDYSENKTISGEIFISYERIIDNAIQNKVPVEEEYLRVIIHGVLHLCGYKDKSEKQKKEMRKKENQYIKLFQSTLKNQYNEKEKKHIRHTKKTKLQS